MAADLPAGSPDLIYECLWHPANASSASGAPSSFTIVYQPGLGSATFVALKVQKTLDKQFPNTNFQWKIVNSGSAVREAILSNQGQLGTLGIPPFLVGWDKGMDWKVLLATSRGDSWLVAKNPKFKTLKDFGPNDKIGVVAPDAQQAIRCVKPPKSNWATHMHWIKIWSLLALPMVKQRCFPDSSQHNSPVRPFRSARLRRGHTLFCTPDVFGPVGAGLIVLPQSFYNQYPAFSKTIYQDLADRQPMSPAIMKRRPSISLKISERWWWHGGTVQNPAR